MPGFVQVRGESPPGPSFQLETRGERFAVEKLGRQRRQVRWLKRRPTTLVRIQRIS
jgi:hypothetical protein